VAFLDEEEDELALPEARARQTRPPRPPRAPRQQLLVRRLAAVGVGLLFLILIVVGIKGCLNARKERAIKDFGSNVSSLITESNQVGEAFFSGLGPTSSVDATEFGTQVKSYRSATESQYERLKSLSTPSEMANAKEALETTFELRRNAMGVIADNIDQAFAKEGAIDAQGNIADQMGLLFASDEVYTGIVLPEVDAAVKQQGISGFPTLPAPCTSTATPVTSSGSSASSNGASSSSGSASSTGSSSSTGTSSTGTTTTAPPISSSGGSCPRYTFVTQPGQEWLDSAKVSDALSGISGATTATATTGVHGMALLGTKIGDTTLDPSTPATVPAGNPVLNVEVQNSGESEESGVTVTVNVGGSTQELPIPRIGPGETQVVKFPLGADLPPSGEQTTIDVTIQPVPGEQATSNNSSTYTVTFQ
jgi:hypothetical protein